MLKVVEKLSDDEFKVRKEALWAVSNAVSGGSPLQIKSVGFSSLGSSLDTVKLCIQVLFSRFNFLSKFKMSALCT